jgi:hypothetical protein
VGTPVIPALESLRQKDWKFKANLKLNLAHTPQKGSMMVDITLSYYLKFSIAFHELIKN